MDVSATLPDHGCRLPQDGRLSHAYLHALIDKNPVAIAVLDRSHSFQTCNAAFHNLFQYSAAELEVWGIDGLLATSQFAEEAREATSAVMMGKQVRLRSKRRRRDGLVIDVEIHGLPLLLDGRIEGVFALYQDLSDHVCLTDLPKGTEGGQNTTRHSSDKPRYHSLSQELTLLGFSLKRLGRLLPGQHEKAEGVLSQTQVLVGMCADLLRKEQIDACDAVEPVATQASTDTISRLSQASLHTTGLTERETEIVRLLACGFSSKEVAVRLDIGTRTVETHRLNVYRKLHLRNIADLVLFAVRTGLLSWEHSEAGKREWVHSAFWL